jgi:hypothetical protein
MVNVKSSNIPHNKTHKLSKKKEQALMPLGVFVLFPWDRLSNHAAQAILELIFLLPQPPECWDNRCATLQQYTTAKLLTMTVTRFFLYSPCSIKEFQSSPWNQKYYTHTHTHTHTDLLIFPSPLMWGDWS